MSDYLKSIKAIHQVLLLASAAVLAFALAPNHEGAIKKADASLAKLEDAATEDMWEDFIERLQNPEQQRADDYLNRLMTRFDPSFQAQSEPMFIATDMNTHYPFAGTLAEARRIIGSHQSLIVFSLKRDTKNLMKQWDDFTALFRPLGQPPAHMSPHLEAINIVPPGGSYSSLRNRRVQIVWPEPSGRDINIQLLFDRTTIPPEANKPSGVNFQTYWETRTDKGGFLALEWIEAIDPDQILVKRLRAGPVFLPAVQPFWDELSGLSIQQARDKLRADLAAQHTKIALSGLSIDSDLTVSVVPWVLSGLLLFFLAHLRQFRRYGLSESKSDGVWVGMFDDWTGSAIAWVTILVLPLVADLLLLLRFDVRETSWAMRWMPTGVLAAMALWSAVELYRLRRSIKTQLPEKDSGGARDGGIGREESTDEDGADNDVPLDEDVVRD